MEMQNQTNVQLVKQSTRDPLFEGLNPAAAAIDRKLRKDEETQKNISFFIFSSTFYWWQQQLDSNPQTKARKSTVRPTERTMKLKTQKSFEKRFCPRCPTFF